MTILEAIHARHSVRRYLDTPLTAECVAQLQTKIAQLNAEGNLHIQLVQDEPRSFKGINSYGMLSGVRNYLVMAGTDGNELETRVGYYGEQLVLYAQQLGLNTCWVGLAYKKIPGTFTLEANEKVVCYIALGYGATQGAGHRIKSPSEVSNASDLTPKWFNAGVDAALLAPTAVNQQKFHIEFVAGKSANHKNKVRIRPKFSIVGYTRIDLGIAKYHFEVGAGIEHFEWV